MTPNPTAMRGSSDPPWRRPAGRDARVWRGGLIAALALLSSCGGSDAGAPLPEALVPLFASFTPAQTQGLPLSLIVQPMSTTVEPDAPVTFVALAEGAPPVRYQWLRDGVPVAGANGPVLRFGATPADDGAQFAVVVSNAADNIVSWPALLGVRSDGRVAAALP